MQIWFLICTDLRAREAETGEYEPSLDDLKQDELFDQIEPDNLQEVTEGIIKRL